MLKKDERLRSIVDTQYRMLHDGSNILVPKGQSTTNPHSREEIGLTSQMTGRIRKGFFTKPLVHFLNHFQDRKVFDRFFLSIWRNADGLPLDDNTIDLVEDMGITTLRLSVDCGIVTQFDDNLTLKGAARSALPVKLQHIIGDTWESEYVHFCCGPEASNNLECLVANGYFTTTPVEIPGQIVIETGVVIQNIALKLVLTNCVAFIGESNIDLIRFNVNPVTIDFCYATVLGGE